MRNNAIVDNREPEDGVGRDADYSGMTAMPFPDFFVEAATKFVAICCIAQ
jgi:hypothetical protein